MSLQDFPDAIGVAAALAGKELGACPHLAGYLPTDVADLLVLQRDTLGIGDKDGQVLYLVLDGIGILRRTGGTANDGNGFSVLDEGYTFVDFSRGKVFVSLVGIFTLDADTMKVLHDLVHMVGVDGIIDGDVPVVIVEVKGLLEHGC